MEQIDGMHRCEVCGNGLDELGFVPIADPIPHTSEHQYQLDWEARALVPVVPVMPEPCQDNGFPAPTASPVGLNTITQGNCLDLLPRVASGSVDMVLCDLPYGTTHNKWDSVIPLPALWEQYLRVIKPSGVLVLSAAFPFTAVLASSNLKWLQYAMVWEKNIPTGHLDARRRPMRKHEDLLVFAPQSYQSKTAVYNPQMSEGKAYTKRYKPGNSGQDSNGSNYGAWNGSRTDVVNEGKRYPTTIIPCACEKGLHPTQKPVALWEYLIRTYTNEGDTVLDNCCGSGTTGVACQNTGRNFIQFELSQEYCEIARGRLRK